jgi:hypothetical protein
MTRRKSDNIKLTMLVSESRDHIQGPATAPVTLLEYGDFEYSVNNQKRANRQALYSIYQPNVAGLWPKDLNKQV